MNATTTGLAARIRDRDVDVCVVGLGYVGLTLACAAAVEGFTVWAVDSDMDRAAALAEGRNVVPGVDDASVALAVDTGRLHVGTEISVADHARVIVICVPTPVHDHRPDVTAIEAAGRALAPHLAPGSLVVLESTTYPGTTEQVLKPLLEADGRRAGRDFLLAYSPERIDPGNPKYGLRNTPRVVGGHSKRALQAALAFYGVLVDDVHAVSGLRAAELAKLLENTFRMTNIALVNELAVLCEAQGIDVWEVIAAAATKPFGYMPFYPGPGVGGHCIPVDPAYLAWQSRRDTGRPFRLVELAQDINTEMPTYVAARIVDALNDHGRAVKGARIFVLGVTYKPNVGDIRESAPIRIIELLHAKGAKVSFHDPFVDRVQRPGLSLRRSAPTSRALAAADCVALLTAHDDYDLDSVVEQSRFVFDARNATRGRAGAKVVTL